MLPIPFSAGFQILFCCAINTIKMFPNPTNGRVSCQYKIASDKGKLELVNIYGSIISSYIVDGKENYYEFDSSFLPGGIVEYRLYDNKVLLGRGSLIIMK